MFNQILLPEYFKILTAISNVALNPFGLLLFLVLFHGDNSSFFTKTGTNTVQLSKLAYGIYIVVFTVAILAITQGVCYILSADVNVWEVYQPRYYWLTFISWGITAFTLYGYFHGMEGNIMGFIYFPMLLVSALGLFIANIADIFSFSINIDTPPVGARYFWLGFAGHAFMPFQTLLFTNLVKDGDQKQEWPVPIITGLVFQILLFVLNWIIVKLFGTGLTFARFFGEGQNLLYFIPMAGGFLYYLLYFGHAKVEEGNRTWISYLAYAVTIVAILTVFLQAFNYIKMFGKWF